MLQWLSRDVALSQDMQNALDRVRHGLAGLALAWFLAVSVTASMSYSVLGTTAESVAPVWTFVLLMWPEMVRELRQLLRSRLMLLTLVVLVVCAAVWLTRGYSLHEPRLRFMLGVGLLFPAAAGWFRAVGHRGMQFALVVKTGVLAFACYQFGVAIWQGFVPRELFARPPVYRHLRHFNYDLALVSGLAGALPAGRRVFSSVLRFLVFVALGYFSFWSGGRGAFLALAVILGTLCLTRRHEDDWRVAALHVAGFVLGGVLVVLGGETYFLFGALERSAKDSANAISSGRLGIWKGTLSMGMSTLSGALFGFGPESFVRMGAFVQFRHYILHPHNTLVQWIFEYGLLGAAALCASALWLAWHCVWPALRAGNLMQRLCAATLVGMSAFALVDGVYYHAAPLLFLTLIWAYLYATRPQG